jgi:hypothetical protein
MHGYSHADDERAAPYLIDTGIVLVTGTGFSESVTSDQLSL